MFTSLPDINTSQYPWAHMVAGTSVADVEQQVNQEVRIRQLQEQALSQQHAGIAWMSLHRYAKAQCAFKQALTLKIKMIKQQENTPSLIADITDTRFWLASAACHLGFLDDAIYHHQHIHNELETGDDEGHGYLQERAVVNLIALSQLVRYQGHVEQAYYHLVEAQGMVSQLLKVYSEDNSTLLSDLFNIRIKQLAICTAANQTHYEDEPTQLLADLNEQSAKIGIRNFSNLRAYFSLCAAQHLVSNSKLFLSKEHIFYALKHYARLIKKSTHYHYYGHYADALLIDAARLRHSRQYPQALERYQQVEELLAPQLKKQLHPRILVPYAKAIALQGKLAAHTLLQEQLKTAGIPLSSLLH